MTDTDITNASSSDASSTSDTVISRFSIPEFDSLPADIQERMIETQEKAGFIPNVFLALARRPDEFRAFMALSDALMDSDDGLSKAEREMIVVATSAANQCLYCVVSHGAILRIRSKRPTLADQLATNPVKADLSVRERQIVEFALDVALVSADIDDNRIDEMKQAGFTEEEIWDIGSIASFFAMSNRLANFGGISPNVDFYNIDRKSVV